jgi:hypothetical protein
VLVSEKIVLAEGCIDGGIEEFNKFVLVGQFPVA